MGRAFSETNNSSRLYSVVYNADTEKEGDVKVVKAMLADVVLLVKGFVPYNAQDIGKSTCPEMENWPSTPTL